MKKVCKIALCVVFILILAACLLRVNYVFRDKQYAGIQEAFKKWNPQHADIVFIGNSHQFCSVDPMLIADEYNLDTFMLATSAQTIPMSYYAAMEAIELNKPDKIVLELCYVANDFMLVDGMDRCFFDGMPMCKAKREAIKDLVPKKERIYYYLPLGLYHSRWKELDEDDFGGFDVNERGGVYYPDDCVWTTDIPLVDESEKAPMPEKMEEYLLKIFELCKNEGVELICYIAPFYTTDGSDYGVYDLLNRERIFNYATDLCQRNDVECYNLFYKIDEIGLDQKTDWKDYQHLNASGQAKFTRYLMPLIQ